MLTTALTIVDAVIVLLCRKDLQSYCTAAGQNGMNTRTLVRHLLPFKIGR
jgi:hypothetical protein